MTRHIEPPHEVRDAAKLSGLVAAMRANGWVGRPLLTIEVADYLQALTGSHRIAAAREAEIEPDVYVIEDRELTAEEIGAIESALPLTWKYYWSEEHYLSEALACANDDEERLLVLRAVLGDDDEATQIMRQEITANAEPE